MISELFRVLETEKDVSKALKKYFSEKVLLGAGNQEAIPLVLTSTHATTFINGIEKSISIGDLKSIISELTTNLEEEITPINLPFGSFMLNKKGEYLYINCYYRETFADIKYDSRNGRDPESFKIPLPNIILSFTLKKVEKSLWQLEKAIYLCTPKTVPQLPDKNIILGIDTSNGIHKLPLSNIYANGKMCFGGNTMPVRFSDNLRGLDYYYQILTLSPFNADLGVTGLKKHWSSREWFKHLSTLKSFPYELLSSEN